MDAAFARFHRLTFTWRCCANGSPTAFFANIDWFESGCTGDTVTRAAFLVVPVLLGLPLVVLLFRAPRQFWKPNGVYAMLSLVVKQPAFAALHHPLSYDDSIHLLDHRTSLGVAGCDPAVLVCATPFFAMWVDRVA